MLRKNQGITQDTLNLNIWYQILKRGYERWSQGYFPE